LTGEQRRVSDVGEKDEKVAVVAPFHLMRGLEAEIENIVARDTSGTPIINLMCSRREAGTNGRGYDNY